MKDVTQREGRPWEETEEEELWEDETMERLCFQMTHPNWKCFWKKKKNKTDFICLYVM
jgi:hypothetical protein